MLYTILQIAAFQALFLLVYDLVLRKETFFNCNRVYLLLTSVLALVLPFIKLPQLKKVTTNDIVIQLPEVFLGAETPTTQEIFIAEQAGIILEQPQTPLWEILLTVGVVVASLIFLFKLSKLYWLKHISPKRWNGNVLMVELLESHAAFSFFNTIFLGDQISELRKATIYKHELVHVKQWHTLDLLFFEALRILFWFNPLVYIFQNRIKELHEFIADAKAVKQEGEMQYYLNLLHQIFDTNNLSFTNTFLKKSLIKKRIAMLQKTKSRQIRMVNYSLLIPIVFVMLIYTSAEVRAQESKEHSAAVDQELTEEELVEKYIDELVTMEENGSSFFDIADYAGVGTKNSGTYFDSKEAYLKSQAYMHYLADGMIKRKSEKGTLTDQDFDLAEKMKLRSNYNQHRSWLETQEAKDFWEARAKDGELRLVVHDLNHKTQAEQQRFDELLEQLHSNANFHKLIVCEATGYSTTVLYDISVEKERMEVPFNVIDEAPTLPQCKNLTTDEKRKSCLSDFIAEFVDENFNIDIAQDLSPGKKRIFVQFKIDTDGHIKHIQARGPSEALEAEAKRVIKLLPQFIPGRQQGELVAVPYSLPIVFQIAGENPSYENTPMYKAFVEELKQKDALPKNKKELLELYMKARLEQKDATKTNGKQN